MKNIYVPIQDFKRALRRNKVSRVFLYSNQFWFYTQKAVWVYQSNDVDKFIVWLHENNIAVDIQVEIR